MKILVAGDDPQANVMGGFLARLGHDVALVGESAHVETARKSGLVMTGMWGDYRIKAFDFFRQWKDVPPEILSEGIILLCSNPAQLPPGTHLFAKCHFEAAFSAPGVITVTRGTGEMTLISPPPGVDLKGKVIEMAHTLSLAKIPARGV